MKQIFKIPMMAIVMLLFSAVQNKSSAQVSVNVSFQTFYDELSPYGEWIDYPEYGYVWSPADRYSNFHPYQSDGHWAWSEDYGWMWVSDYDWGWAPFHYGRWIYDDWYGWLWVPDYEWGPAWVVWRGGGDYYGWAPMRPGISIGINFGSYNPPYNYWCFAPSRYISSPHISNYYVDRSRNMTIINNTTIINNYSRNRDYFTGPSRHEAERYTGSRIQPVRIRESQSAGRTIARNNEVSIYKPYINRGSDRGAPRTFENYRSQQRTNDGRITNRQQNTDAQNRGTSRVERPYQNRGNQRIEGQQTPRQNNQRIERQQTPDQDQRIARSGQGRGNQRIEQQQAQNPNGNRIERQQASNQNSQRVERPYQGRGNQRIEGQQAPGQNQRMERQQTPGQNQRMERQQAPGQNQRIERQQTPNQNNQRVERSYQNRGQQPQTQSQPTQEQRGNGNGNGNGRGKGRGD